MTDPRRVLAHLDPAAVHRRQWDAAIREESRRQMEPFNRAIRAAYEPALARWVGAPRVFGGQVMPGNQSDGWRR